MATVTFDGTRVNDAEALTNGTWTWVRSTSSGAAATLEPDYFYQGSNCISGQIKTAYIGFVGYDTGTSYNYTTGPSVWLAKIIQTNKDAIDGVGLTLEIGSDTGAGRSNLHLYNVFLATTYPIYGGWQIIPIDPNLTAYRDSTIGSPSLTAVSSYGIRSDANATAKAPNLGIDAVDFITNGTGLTITGASSSFADFITFDEGTANNRYGIVSTKEGILYVTGVLTIGSAPTSVAFSDSNTTLVFPGGRVRSGFSGIDLDLSNASTTATLTSITMIGRGYNAYGDFHTNDDINTTTDAITTNQVHGFSTGDEALYSKEGGTDSMGLTDATNYFVNANSTTELSCYTTKANAEADTSRVALSLSGGTETHTLTKTNDTRPNLDITGTSGSATVDACALTNFNLITLNSVTTFSDNTVNSCQTLTQDQATISGCTFDSSPVLTNTPFMTVKDMADVSTSTFVSGGLGHAMELTSDHAASPTEHTLSGVTFTGYSGTTGSNLVASSGDPDAAIYNNSGKALIINIAGGGNTPSVRNGASATTTIVNNKTIDVHVQDATNTDIQDAVVGIYKDSDDTEVSNSLTDVNGDITTASIAAGTAVYIRVRKSSTGSTRYIPVETSATIDDNTSLTVTLIEDSVVAA